MQLEPKRQVAMGHRVLLPLARCTALDSSRGGNHNRVGLGLSEPEPLASAAVIFFRRRSRWLSPLVLFGGSSAQGSWAAKILWDQDDRYFTDVDGPDEKNFPSRKHFLEKRSGTSK
jgi:hypothetical protein